jgi:hypothetical protein
LLSFIPFRRAVLEQVLRYYANDAKFKTITYFATQNAVYFFWIVSIKLSYAKVRVIISIRFSEKTKKTKKQKNLEGSSECCPFLTALLHSCPCPLALMLRGPCLNFLNLILLQIWILHCNFHMSPQSQ